LPDIGLGDTVGEEIAQSLADRWRVLESAAGESDGDRDMRGAREQPDDGPPVPRARLHVHRGPHRTRVEPGQPALDDLADLRHVLVGEVGISRKTV
jgi:hypothetical protein